MERSCFNELEDLILLRRQYPLNWFIDPMQSLSKFQFLFCWNGQAESKIHIELQGIPQSQNSFEKEQIKRIHTSWFQNFV